MTGWVLPIAAWVLLTSAVAECAADNGCACGAGLGECAGNADCLGALARMLKRGAVAPDVSLLAAYELPGETPPPAYRALRAGQCQCLAATESTLGRLLDSERRMVLSLSAGRFGRVDAAVCLLGKVLACRAVEERNRAADAALFVYYRLAEAEAKHDAVRAGLQEIHAAIDNLGQLTREGLQVSLDEGELTRQKLDLLAQEVQVRLAIRQLNGRLAVLLGCEADHPMPFWPADPLQVVPEAIDTETAVRRGLSNRADLAVLRILYCHLDEHTLAAIRSGLEQVEVLMGSSPTAGKRKGCPLLSECLQKCRDGCEIAVRRRQLLELWHDRERAAAEEIRQAACEVETRLHEAALAKQKRDSWRQSLDRLSERRRLGVRDAASVFEQSEARLEVIRAQSELVHQVVAWKLALVKFRAAQGRLAAECGYLPPADCCRVCNR